MPVYTGLFSTNFVLRMWMPAMSFPKIVNLSKDGLDNSVRILSVSKGAFHSTKNSGNSGTESEWNSHFPEFHSEILGVPREVGLKFRKIGITGKFCSIRPFLLGPSFSEPENRIQHG